MERDESQRPWGGYAVLGGGPRFQVKRIEVLTGRRFSLQRHRRRMEQWVVVRGVARVTCGDEVSELREGDAIRIPLGAVHRLENPGPGPLQVIEVQIGDYLGEDDIERLDDDYGRA